MAGRFLLSAALLAALGTTVAGAAEPQRLALRTDIVVQNDVVTMGDLIEGAGPLASTPAFRAPPLGRSGTIQVPRVLEAAHGAGLTVNPGLATQVVVTRAARRIEKSAVEAAVQAALGLRYGLSQPDVNLTLEGSEPAVWIEPDARGELKVTDLTYDPRSQHVEAVLTVAGSRALTLKPLRAAGQVVDTVEVPVLVRALARGETVRPSDIRLERRPRAEIGAVQGTLLDPAAIAGRVARVSLQAGAPAREADFAKQDLVDKNSAVSVLYRMPGIELSMRGKALESGGIGDVVLVLNPQSKRQLQATVTGPGQVTVVGAMPGPVASAQ